jgi:hypothetical protein
MNSEFLRENSLFVIKFRLKSPKKFKMLKVFKSFPRLSFISKSFSSEKQVNFTPAKLPDLPYDYNALEPVISAEIMKIHHSKHHQAYVTNYNKAVEDFLDAQAKNDISKATSLQGAIRFNGGGHINHSIFWTNLTSPKNGGGELPSKSSKLSEQVHRDFGSFENLISEISKRSVGVHVTLIHFYELLGIWMGLAWI